MKFTVPAGALEVAGLLALAFTIASIMVLAALNRKKLTGIFPALEDIVSLDAKGWRFVATIATIATVILIATSQLYGTVYWTGIAISTEGLAWPETCTGDVCQPVDFWTLGGAGEVLKTYARPLVIGAVLLSIVFELMADFGTPIASGLRATKRRATPQWLIIATIAAVAMSVVSKWGIYEDGRNAHAAAAQRSVIQNSEAQTRLNEAQAIIDRLANAPSKAIATEQRATIERQLKTMRESKAEAEKARDNIPESHSTNRNAAQDKVDGWARDIVAKEGELLQAKKIEEDAAALEKARADRAQATADLEALAGSISDDKGEAGEVSRVGDSFFARALRAFLHQLLCFLSPIVALDASTIAREKKKQEEANRKRSETMREKARTVDAEFEEAAEPETTFGGFLPDGTEEPDEDEADEVNDDSEFEPPADQDDEDAGSEDEGAPNA